jgi:hypothetical protein
VFRDERGKEYVGPMWSPIEDLDALDELVRRWCA